MIRQRQRAQRAGVLTVISLLYLVALGITAELVGSGNPAPAQAAVAARVAEPQAAPAGQPVVAESPLLTAAVAAGMLATGGGWYLARRLRARRPLAPAARRAA